MASPLHHWLPSAVVRDRVLPFTYCPQPAALCEDLRSYHRTTSHVKTLYGTRFPTVAATAEEESDLAWLSNDICRFLNNDQPTMLGYVAFYRGVFQRLYMNHIKDLSAVRGPPLCGADNFNDIKVSIGLLLPKERQRLETFLGACT